MYLPVRQEMQVHGPVPGGGTVGAGVAHEEQTVVAHDVLETGEEAAVAVLGLPTRRRPLVGVRV